MEERVLFWTANACRFIGAGEGVGPETGLLGARASAVEAKVFLDCRSLAVVAAPSPGRHLPKQVGQWAVKGEEVQRDVGPAVGDPATAAGGRGRKGG